MMGVLISGGDMLPWLFMLFDGTSVSEVRSLVELVGMDVWSHFC